MSSDDQFLEAAVSIGRDIVADAVWHDGRCNWVGVVPDPARSSRTEYAALGPDLYAGTAGVGLFLAHLARASDEAAFRRASIGALRHAAWHTGQPRDNHRAGFHAGSRGTAWASARVARLLGEEELRVHARELLTLAPPPPDPCPDLIMGTAGSILGLLGLAEELDEPRLIEDACAAGTILTEGATVTSHGWSWRDNERRYPQHLCGVAHGAGGIGWALLELFAATREELFEVAATGAFAYERSWLDRRSGRWADVRIRGQRRGAPPMINPGITGTWCYGEVGIALSRLRAITLLGPGPHYEDAEIALETTRLHLADALPYAIDDLSLCHGAAGGADVLLCAAMELGGRWRAAADLATQLGQVALERYAEPPHRWPCGAPGETTPGLFRGLGGIGWLFLRLHDISTPSPLLPGGDA